MTTPEQSAELFELQEEKGKATARKRDCEGRLTQIKNEIRGATGRMPDRLYRDLCKEQEQLGETLRGIEQRLTEIKNRSRELSSESMPFEGMGRIGPQKLYELGLMRDRYQHELDDPKWEPPGRLMAGVLVDVLNEITKQ